MGPMFRYERPQKGRYRQFHQIDVEALGFPGPDVDAELILMTARLWRVLGLRGLKLEPQFARHAGVARGLSREARRVFPGASRPCSTRTARAGSTAIRCASSTARIRRWRAVIAGAPLITDHLDAESARAFRDALRSQLDGGRRRLRRQSAPGARARLLFAHGVRVGDDRPRLAGRGLLGRPLRWPRRAARRRGGAGHRLGARRGAYRRADAPAGTRAATRAARTSTWCWPVPRRKRRGSGSRSASATARRACAWKRTAAAAASSRS